MQIKITVTPEDYLCLKKIKDLISKNNVEDSGIIDHILESFDDLLEQTR